MEFFEAQIPVSPEIESEIFYVYVKKDGNNRIISVNSSKFVSPEWGIEIDSGAGDKYAHAQKNYFDENLTTDDGIPKYKLENGKAVLREIEEIETDRKNLPVPPPTEEEQLRADVDFLAVMTGVEL